MFIYLQGLLGKLQIRRSGACQLLLGEDQVVQCDLRLFINDVINFRGYRDPPPLPLVIIRHFLATPPPSLRV